MRATCQGSLCVYVHTLLLHNYFVYLYAMVLHSCSPSRVSGACGKPGSRLVEGLQEEMVHGRWEAGTAA